MVLFVGDQPSKHNTSPDVAFVGTRSFYTLCGWIKELGLTVNDCRLINRTDKHIDIEAKLQQIYGFPIVALGNNAAKALRRLKAPFFPLPHPSGLNRKLNDKEWLAKQLSQCKLWLVSQKERTLL